MGKIAYTEGTGVPHRRFEDEFLTHKKCSEWWYATGYFEDEEKNLFAFQFTLAKVKISGLKFHMLLTSVTDVATGAHYNGQQLAFFGKGVTSTHNETAFGELATIRYNPNDKSVLGDMRLVMNAREYALRLSMRAQKAPVWHCEDGKLQMGVQGDPRQVTYYYSFTNMLADGTLTLNGKEHKVRGKAWFDRQGGTYALTKPVTNWEWFSLRFFDNEELMLFSFPQTGYVDGTYIRENGEYRRADGYGIEPLTFITEPNTQYRFSSGWKVRIPGVKEEDYLIRPVTDGQFNIFFFELLAEILNPKGERVGLCFVELLPGARNDKIRTSLAFKRQG